MDAAGYTDWCRHAGIYLGNHSHAERYSVYQAKLSFAGLATRIVHDFLEDNAGGIDVAAWRSHCVYEVGEWAAYRVEQTALALEAVGAPRVAARVRTARDTSPFGRLLAGGLDLGAMEQFRESASLPDMMAHFRESVARAMGQGPTEPVPPSPDTESWEQIEHLLARYVEAKQDDLLADVEKYGDPRREPGFDPEMRQKELAALRHAEWDRGRQKENLAEMQERVAEIEGMLAKKVKRSRLSTPRRKLLEHYRDYTRRDPGTLIPELREWLPVARAFAERHADLLFPRPTSDAGLLARLAALGEHDVDIHGREVTLSYADPAGLTCGWLSLSLRVTFPAGDDDALRGLLDRLDAAIADFPRRSEGMRQEVLDHFDIYRDWWGAQSIEWSERGEDGGPTEAAILAAVEGGRLHADATGNDGGLIVHLSVPWDDEHGLELSLEGGD